MMNLKKKICFVTTEQNAMEWFVLPNAKNLSKHGYEITLVCSMDESFAKKVKSFAKTYSLSMKRGVVSIISILKAIKKLKQFFKKEKFDIVQYATPNASFYSSIAAHMAKVPIRIYNQWGIRYVSASGFSRFLMRQIEKITCKHSTTIRAVSAKNMEFGILEKLYKREKVKVLGIGGTIGVDLNEFDLVNKDTIRNQLLQELEIKSDSFVFGFVGRINRDKGVNELLMAFKEISEVHNTSYLIMVGMNDLVNPIRTDLMEWAQKCEHVKFIGQIPNSEVPRYLFSFDVLVHPTYREGFGKILQEAMAAEIAILTTDIPGPSEVIEDRVSGILVPSHNYEALKEAMIYLKCNPLQMDTIAKNGRKRVEEYFSRSKMLNNYLVDIKELLSSSE